MKAIRYITLFLTILLWLVPTSNSFAQRDKVEELRASFIAKKLDLSSTESEKFWPVYNELNDKRKAIKRNLRKTYKTLPTNYSDSEAEAVIDLENKSIAAEAELTKTYNDKFKSIIGIKKLVKLQMCEDEFKLELLKAAKQK